MAEVGVVKAETPELLSQCEFVTLHSPLIPETQDMISVEEFGQMRSDGFLINCARGGLVDEEALYSALTSGAIAGAGLDVLVDLQPPLDHRIIQLDNVIVTPHTAFFSQEATLELEERAAEAVIDVFKGRTPANVFNKSVLESSRQDVS